MAIDLEANQWNHPHIIPNIFDISFLWIYCFINGFVGFNFPWHPSDIACGGATPDSSSQRRWLERSTPRWPPGTIRGCVGWMGYSIFWVVCVRPYLVPTKLILIWCFPNFWWCNQEYPKYDNKFSYHPASLLCCGKVFHHSSSCCGPLRLASGIGSGGSSVAHACRVGTLFGSDIFQRRCSPKHVCQTPLSNLVVEGFWTETHDIGDSQQYGVNIHLRIWVVKTRIPNSFVFLKHIKP